MDNEIRRDDGAARFLSSARLVIEPLAWEGRDAFVAYRRDPDVARYQSWDTSYDTAAADALIRAQPAGLVPPPGDWVQLAVRLRDAPPADLLGDVAVHTDDAEPDTYEIGVTLAPAAQHHGYGREAVGRVVEHLFRDRGAHRVRASCDVRNGASAALLRAVGMRHEGRAIDAEWCKGEWTSVDAFAVVAGEWGRVGMP